VSGVLHADFIFLRSETTAEERREILLAAAGPASLPEVTAAAAIQGSAGSGADLVLVFVLRAFTDLEPFGTSPAYVSFLQSRLAPKLRSLSGIDARLVDRAALPPAAKARVLALRPPPETFDWEVQVALERWAGAAGLVGLAANDKQGYRGVAVASTTDIRSVPALPEGFECLYAAGDLTPLR
jgi:hypothetical protein